MTVAASPEELAIHAQVTELVELLIRSRGPTKKDLASLLGISPSSLSHTLRPQGTYRPRLWRVSDLVVLSEYYDVSLDVLLGMDCRQRDEVVHQLRGNLEH